MFSEVEPVLSWQEDMFVLVDIISNGQDWHQTLLMGIFDTTQPVLLLEERSWWDGFSHSFSTPSSTLTTRWHSSSERLDHLRISSVDVSSPTVDNIPPLLSLPLPPSPKTNVSTKHTKDSYESPKWLRSLQKTLYHEILIPPDNFSRKILLVKVIPLWWYPFTHLTHRLSEQSTGRTEVYQKEYYAPVVEFCTQTQLIVIKWGPVHDHKSIRHVLGDPLT